MRYSDIDLEKTRCIIASGQNVAVAVQRLRSYIQRHGLSTFEARLDRIGSDYELMKGYMRKGLKDPQFEQVYNALLRALYCLNSDIQLYRLVRENASYMGAWHSARAVDADFETIRRQLEGFVQDVTMLSLESQDVRRDRTQALHDRHQQYVDNLFCAILVSPQWIDSTANFAQELLLSPTIDAQDAQLLLGAMTLSAIQLFDIRKFLTLAHVCQHAVDEHVRQRALVGVALALPNEEGNIFPEVQHVIDELCHSEQTCREWMELQMQFFYCLKADADYEKLQRDIIPTLMRGTNITISRAGIVEKDEDSLQEILNPGAEDQAMEEMESKFNQMMSMQKAGSDVYFGGFSQMKRFPFFATLSNWFVPFYGDHPALRQANSKIGDSRFMQLLLENGPFCDSDKYSFALAVASIIDRIPDNMREIITNKEVMGPGISKEERRLPAYLRRMYLQDLYRFYRVYPNRSDFHNPFDRGQKANSAFFVVSRYFHDSPLAGRVLELGKFLYKHRFYQELRCLLDTYADHEDAEYWRLSALLHERLKEYAVADAAYDRLLELNPADPQAMWGKAHTGFYLENYGQAIHFYRLLLDTDPDNERVLLNLAVSLVNHGDIDEGMRHLFKLNYEHPEDLSIQRSLAWGYLRQQRPQQAEPIYRRLLANQHRMPTDCLNAGYCMWFLSDVEQAITLFRQYEEGVRDVAANSQEPSSLHSIFLSDAALLQQYHIGREEALVMEDLVRGECLVES